MFYYLSGKLAIKNENFVVIDVAGAGYLVYMATPSIANLPSCGDEVKVFTYVNVKEDGVTIYGFCSEAELSMFKMLISVSGVGPKAGLSILSSIGLSDFALAVITDDDKTITQAPGIGPKTAKRIVLELKDKMKTEDAIENLKDTPKTGSAQGASGKSEVIAALMALGYANLQARQAVNAVYESELTIENNIKKALAKISE